MLWPTGEHLIVLFHDVGDDLDAWGAFPAAMASRGYAVLAIDLPGHGMSDDPWGADRLPGIVTGMLAHARTLTPGKCFAACMGSTAPVVSEAGFAALVAISPRLVPDQSRETGRTPCLIFVGSADGEAASEAERYFRSRVGWTVSSSFGVAAKGVDLLSSEWGGHIYEQTVAFFRDYQERGGT